MQREMQIILEVNSQAEKFYDDAIQLGDHAAYALRDRHRAQMTGLENVAESAFKVSDVLDYVKRQTGRFPYWQKCATEDASFKGTSKEPFGDRLKHYLEHELKNKRDIICKNIGIGEENDANRAIYRRVYLLLIRQFVRQMVIQYEYRVSSAKAPKGAEH